MMNGELRRSEIIKIIGTAPLSATKIAEKFGVSRQVIVQDMALIRANGYPIIATNRGYILSNSRKLSRVYKVKHSDEETGEELNLIVDAGGTVEDVFVNHKYYGKISAEMHIRSRAQVDDMLQKLKSGKSTLLKKITSDYHNHTVTAESESVLDDIQNKLSQRGFLIIKNA